LGGRFAPLRAAQVSVVRTASPLRKTLTVSARVSAAVIVCRVCEPLRGNGQAQLTWRAKARLCVISGFDVALRRLRFKVASLPLHAFGGRASPSASPPSCCVSIMAASPPKTKSRFGFHSLQF